MEIKEELIINLKPYPKNAKKHPKEQIDLIKKSIQEFGFKVPLVIDQAKNIICGHGRYQAAKQLSIESIPCIIAEDLTEEQIRSFRIIDNKVTEMGEWDIDILRGEFNELKINNQDFVFEGFDIESDLYQSDKEYKKPKTKYKECPQCGYQF